MPTPAIKIARQRITENKHVIILACIVVLALLTRLIHLGSFPTNFHEDEVLVGYVGRFILEHGRDLYGNPWPLWYFDKFGDYYIVGPFYLSGLSTLLFGLNEFAVRFPTAFFGALSVIPMYVFSRYLTGNKSIALLSSFALSLMPWHIVLSRTSTEGITGGFFSLSGLALFLLYIQKKQKPAYILGVFSFLASYWIYHPYRIYTPVFILFFLIFYLNQLRRNQQVTSILVAGAIFSVLTFVILSTPWGQGRLNQTSIFSPVSGVEIKTQELIYNIKGDRTMLARVLHNKLWGYGKEFLAQYTSYISPKYLLLEGWSEKYVVPSQGMLYFTYFIAGSIAVLHLNQLLKDHSLRNSTLFFISLVLFVLIPPALTFVGSPNANRSMMFGILLSPVIGYGLHIVNNWHKYLFYLVLSVIVLESLFFGAVYGFHFDKANSITRQDAVRPLIHSIQKFNTGKIYLPAESTKSIYYLFYTNNLDSSLSGKFEHDVRIRSIGNVYFYPQSNCLRSVEDFATFPRIDQDDVIVQHYTCGHREYISMPDTSRLVLTEEIREVNELLGYYVYKHESETAE